MKYLVILLVLIGIMGGSDSFAVPPMERVPLQNLVIQGVDDSMPIKSNQQYTIRTDYQSNFPNTEYVILYQITNEKNQVVLLSWLEGFQQKLTDQPGSFVCGDKICYNEWTYSEPYVCGDKICEGKFYAQKFVETSWLPTEPGKYRITAFAWESVGNPTALSPPISTEVIVQD
ncbi:hypothetical protein NKOR_06180 [Candidatus Nitrosopumilus koreensis AR1]|uniref:Uncharacterized protein n=1 Tax=Candidatus Nitrosopumilus koreensis AR1 TaxID=1229908 RepID=K0B7H0_9ARCH|nr:MULTISPECIES: hypothetical protein [Nitrosopumilus]AFS81117.1 hypothetical protein NKOR_06180 [Candidatus Nitrosopumilus koreensis AR1]